MFSELTDKVFKLISKVPFNTMIAAVWISYASVFVLALFLCLVSRRVRAKGKGPYLAFTNAYAGVNLALFMLEKPFEEAAVVAVLFWLVGYLTYGLLCAITLKPAAATTVAVRREPSSVVPAVLPVAPAPQHKSPRPELAANGATPVKNSVRLDHAAAVTDKLLAKNLSKADRAELEKLKNTLAVLQIKGTLTPTEAEILNGNFNALLKLMAKYNV